MKLLASINRYAFNIIESYINEIDNDIASIDLTSSYYNKLFFFKNYKVNNLPKLKKMAFVIVSSLMAFTPLFFVFCFFYFIFLTIVSVFFVRVRTNKLNMCLVTGSSSEYNFSLLPLGNENLVLVQYKNYDLLKYLGFIDILKAATVCLFFNIRILLNVKCSSTKISRSLRVHALDSIKLCLFQRVVINCCKSRINIYLDSHYERWNYIASKIAPLQHCIIQHGFVRKDIPFKHSFGGVAQLFVYDSCFFKSFNAYYYEINNVFYIKSRLVLVPIAKRSRFTLMLASSPVSIEIELRFLEFITKSDIFDVYVKLHPLHDYKHRFNNYNSLSFTNDYLDSDVLVTFNSFLGFEYQSLGKFVTWLNDDCSIEEHVRRICCSIEKG